MSATEEIGKVLLDLPIRRMLESGKPDFPFCICWANENWTRRWDGLEDDVLIAQSHSPEDDINFIRHVENVLLQKNYIRVRGKPLLLVYRPSLFPDSLETTERWRDYFRRKGHGELHLVMVRSFHDQTAPERYGFDADVQFPPHFSTAPITSLIGGKDAKFKGTIYDYSETRRIAIEQLTTASSKGETYAAVMGTVEARLLLADYFVSTKNTPRATQVLNELAKDPRGLSQATLIALNIAQAVPG